MGVLIIEVSNDLICYFVKVKVIAGEMSLQCGNLNKREGKGIMNSMKGLDMKHCCWFYMEPSGEGYTSWIDEFGFYVKTESLEKLISTEMG